MAAAPVVLSRRRSRRFASAVLVVITALVLSLLGVAAPAGALPGDITVSDPVVTEGTGGTTTAAFTITADPGTVATVSYTTRNGTAVAPGDYTTVTNTHQFTGGGSHVVNVPVVTDAIPEPNEDFFLDVTVTAGFGSCTDCPGRAQITNDDGSPPELSVNDVTVTEGTPPNTATFTITRTGNTAGPVSVSYTTTNGTATAGSDYTTTTGTATFAAGETQKPVVVPILQDTLDEPSETFNVVLSNAVNAVIATGGDGLGTILDDDATPTLSINDPSVAEGSSGTTQMVFTVTLSAASSNEVLVNFNTANGTATAGTDYTARSGTLTIPAGQTSASISVPVIGDTVNEPNETFTVSLTGPVNAEISKGSGVGTITNDDAQPTLSINDPAPFPEGNSGTTNGTFTVTLQGTTTAQTVTVNYTTANGTATAGSDYTTRSGTLTFEPGDTTETIPVPILGDAIDEADETFTVTLSNPINATITKAVGTGTIADDEATPTLSVSDTTPVLEGGSRTFTVTLSAASGRSVTVDYATANGTATAGVDFNPAGGTFTFAPGETTKTVDVTTLGDSAVEGTETYTLQLSNAVNATIADGSGNGSILDEDTNQFSIDDVIVTEGTNPTATFTVSRPSGGGAPATVTFTTADNTATAGSDYTTTTNTLTFNGGDLEETITVPILNDGVPENTETFFVNLTAATNGVITDGQGVGTIQNDDGPLPASVTIADSSATEGDASTTQMTFTVTRSGSTASSVTVTYTTSDGTATAGADYTASTGTVTIPAGQTTATFQVPVLGDTVDEPNETFTVTLSNPTNANLGTPSTATGTINDNDVPSISVDSPSVSEGTGGTSTLTFTVTMSVASSRATTVQYATGGGTATPDDDYTPAAGTLTFAAGETSKTISVTVIADALDEDNETLILTLSNPASHATLGTPSSGTGTITDDDDPPTMAIGDVTLPEGNTGTTNAVFTVNLSGPSGRSVSATYTAADGTAVQPGDYSPATGTVTFAPGEITKTVSVPVVGDLLDEDNETFTVTLTTPTNTSFTTAIGTATITDDDDAPTVSIDSPSVAEGNSATANLTFDVRLSAASSKQVTVVATTSDGTAVAPGDYTARTATLTFAPGAISQPFTVVVNGDTIDETNETLTVTLSAPSNATLGTPSTGTGTITDDDGTPTASIGNATVNEGNSGTATATFTVTLSNASSSTVTVTATTSNGTATAPGDYLAKSTTVTFEPGDTSKPFTVVVNGDTSDEANETFTVTLTNPTNATLGSPSAGTGTITDDDGTPTASIGNATVTEGNSGTVNATFTVTLSNTSGSDVTVGYATANGSAVQPGDYTATTGTLTIPANQTSGTITVPVVGDALDEANETFTVTLSNPTNATLGTPSTGTGTITDDDATPTLSVSDATATEGNAGTKAVTYTITMSAPSSQPVTVNFATVAGSATAGIDYRTTSGTAAINPGQTSTTFTVDLVGDTTDEADETYTVTLSSPTNATIADGTGAGTITDDDDPAPTTPTAAPQGYSLVGEDGSLYAFGTAKNLGDMRGKQLNAPIIGVAYTPGGNGYWLVARDGGIFTFGDADFFGSMGDKKLNSPVIGMAATPTGKGYWLFAGDGGIFTFGDAEFFGSMGDKKLNAPVINMEPLASGRGYWLVAADGGIFTFGLGDFFGSMGDQRLNQPVFDMTSTDSDRGYWLVARDGGIFSFGDAEAKFFGSAVNETPRPTKVIGMDSTPGSQGYWIADASGKIYRYGDAQDLGDRSASANPAPMVAFATVPSLKP